MDRRTLLKALGALGVLSATPARGQAAQPDPRPRFLADPFSLGVASGYPQPNGIALWTRLAPLPDAPGGGLPPVPVAVRWEIARDEKFASMADAGTAWASPEWAHSVHVESSRLEPGRPYWYRFIAGDALSPVGRTRTAPAANGKVDRLRFAFASCQHYEQGHFNAYRHMLDDELDLVVFLGDYIYESSWGRDHVRKHLAPEPYSLEDYRIRHALYKSDPDLRAAHAAIPWVVTWDDHEVDNDYADAVSEQDDRPEWFLARRAAAYKAYYEHMPLRRGMLPMGPYMKLHTRIDWGQLAQFHVLDDRQYRSAHACPRPGRAGSNVVDPLECSALNDRNRSLLGAAQERWLEAGLASSKARWNLLAQQSLMSQFDQKSGDGRRAWTDAWDGYPASRTRLFEALQTHKVANPVSLGGDVHAFYVADLKRNFDDPRSATLGTEFVSTSITSQAWAQETINRFLPDNPHVKLAESRSRGYTRAEISARGMQVDLRAMQSVATRESTCSTLSSWLVEDGRPGAQKV